MSSFGSEFALLVIRNPCSWASVLEEEEPYWKAYFSVYCTWDGHGFIEHADLIYDYCIKYDHGCGENSDLSYGVEEIC